MKRTYKILALTLALLTMLSALASCGAANKGDDYGNPGQWPNYNAPSNGLPEGAMPDEEPSDNGESGFVENPFIATGEQNVSTFSADVDTASYSYFRKLVMQNQPLDWLQKSASSFRTEEFINYFKYEATAPQNGSLFGVNTTIVNCPWNANTVLMRLTLQAEQAIEPTANNLVFLIDVSGSMGSYDKLPLLKSAFSNLVGRLTEDDVVSIVTYSGREAVVLEGCPGNQSERIMAAINGLTANGSTNGQAGMQKAYQIAERYMIEGGNNRIIMASDGDLNVGITSEEELKSFIEGKRDAGVYLSVLGFGTGNYKDSKMEALADNGNGVYYYIDGESEAERVLGSDLFSMLYTVAKDVKLQITFDPQYISSYRLIGYENRILSEEDYEDDTKDAGDVGAGHQVTVCYELTLAEGARETDAPWMELGVRYKPQGSDVSVPNNYKIGKADLKSDTDADTAFIVCLIQTCMVLHNSKYLNGMTIAGVLENLQALDLSAYPEREEFRSLIAKLAA